MLLLAVMRRLSGVPEIAVCYQIKAAGGCSFFELYAIHVGNTMADNSQSAPHRFFCGRVIRIADLQTSPVTVGSQFFTSDGFATSGDRQISRYISSFYIGGESNRCTRCNAVGGRVYIRLHSISGSCCFQSLIARVCCSGDDLKGNIIRGNIPGHIIIEVTGLHDITDGILQSRRECQLIALAAIVRIVTGKFSSQPFK